ncbi:AAA family ATPase [Catellatospora paridis]|uniref:AAA family ATPase n=1 Tax=Catellatospora paridis TaxID=1617086 RepID=UPI0012D423B0|nr:AAA family ATPase [Catellatospora paridis]
MTTPQPAASALSPAPAAAANAAGDQNQAATTLGARALQFLQDHPTSAYTVRDLNTQLSITTASGGLHAALVRLADAGYLLRDSTVNPQTFAAHPSPPADPPQFGAANRAPTSSGLPRRTAAAGSVVKRPNGRDYHTRMLAGGRDVDVLRNLRQHDIPVLLYGPPGTGKTSMLEAAFGDDLYTVNGDADTVVGDFVGDYIANGDGTYSFVDGPLVLAMETGGVLFVDDATIIPPQVMPVIYPVMDGRGVITIKSQNRQVTAKPGFYVVAAHNPFVHGAVLSPALASRFSIQVEVPTDYHLARRLGVPAPIVAVAKAMADNDACTWAPQMRELTDYARVNDALGRTVAVNNLVSVCPEDDRPELIRLLADKIPGVAADPLAVGGTRKKATP